MRRFLRHTSLAAASLAIVVLSTLYLQHRSVAYAVSLGTAYASLFCLSVTLGLGLLLFVLLALSNNWSLKRLGAVRGKTWQTNVWPQGCPKSEMETRARWGVDRMRVHRNGNPWRRAQR